jgi:hypothetical protein
MRRLAGAVAGAVAGLWPFKRKQQSPDVEIFTQLARRVLDEIMAGDSYTATVFKSQSAADLADFWNQKQREIVGLVGTDGVMSARTLRLRAHWAHVVEQLALAAYYADLPEEDRGIFATYALNSTRQAQDEFYRGYLAVAQFDVRFIESLFRHGWDGDAHALEKFLEMASLLNEQCNLQYVFMLENAKTKLRGEEIPETRKDSARTDLLIKEASRRRLAGIPLDDEK